MKTENLEEVLTKFGITARAEARGETRGEARGEARGKEIKAKEFAQKLIQKGWASIEIAETTELDIETVESLMRAAHA